MKPEIVKVKMCFFKKFIPAAQEDIKLRAITRQLGCVALTISLFACTGSDAELGPKRILKDFAGGVVGDEPRSVLEAREILSSGGNAADAATAMYFALAVTLPSAASLGGGGTCMIYRPKISSSIPQKIEAIQFLTGQPASIPKSAVRPSGVPGNSIGIFALHARYGAMSWRELVSVGERLARFGTQMSRSLLTDLRSVEDALFQDPESRRIFRDASGDPINKGGLLRQPDLARTLSNIRTNGPMDFYRGKLAATFVDRVRAAGGSLSLEDMQNYKPRWSKTISIDYAASFFDKNKAHFVPPPAIAGLVQAQLLAMLKKKGVFVDANENEKYHVLAELGLTAFAERSRWMRNNFESKFSPESLLDSSVIASAMKNFSQNRHQTPQSFRPVPRPTPENPSATTFVIVDQFGMAVTCAFTMNNLFGTGRIARDTGIMLAAIPRGKGPVSLGPMMIVNEKSGQFLMAAAASGGVAAPTSLSSVVARSYLAGQNLEEAIRAPRVHHSGAPDVTYYETTLPKRITVDLQRRGHRVSATSNIGLVNIVYCSGGLPRDRASCSLLNDPRGNGLSASTLGIDEE